MVALIGIPAFNQFIQEPTEIQDLQTNGGTSNRLPATVKKELWLAKAIKKGNSVFVSCQKEWRPQNTHLAKVRIEISDCEREEFKVENKTNQYTATVFPINQRIFTTDFIDLIEGDNEILISTKTKDQQWESKTLRLVRSSSTEK